MAEEVTEGFLDIIPGEKPTEDGFTIADSLKQFKYNVRNLSEEEGEDVSEAVSTVSSTKLINQLEEDLEAAVNPEHYRQGKIEVMEFIEDQKLNFALGNAIKYICRAGKKDVFKTTEDLEKAVWYVKREIAKINE